MHCATRRKVAGSIPDALAWAVPLERGGYTVYPVPASLSTVLLVSSEVSDGGGGTKSFVYSLKCYICLVLPVLMVLISFQNHQL